MHTLSRYEMVCAMGRVGAAGDNAAMESFFSLLKKNVLDRRRWHTRDTPTARSSVSPPGRLRDPSRHRAVPRRRLRG